MPAAAHWTTLDSSLLLLYLIGMLAVGVLIARRIRSFDDYFRAGGRMTTPILVCTLVSTYYGLDVTFGTSETAFYEGLAAFVSYSAPFYLAYAATALLVAPRLSKLPVRSLPEAMEHHYGRSARLAGAIASFFYSAPILSVAGMGLIGELVLGWDFEVAALAGAAIALAYTLLGGLLADAVTDTVQFTIMCLSVAVAAALALHGQGGPAVVGARLEPVYLRAFGDLRAVEVLVYGSIALTPLVEPAFYQRVFAATGLRSIRRALLIGIALWVAFDWLVVYLGLIGRDMVARGVLAADLDPSAIILHVTLSLLPTGLLGLFVAGCVATAMSTIDSYTLIAAGNLVYDGYQPLARRKLSDRGLLAWTRLASLIALAAALLLALRFERLRDAWIFMATVLLSTTLVPMLAGLFLPWRPRPQAGSWSAWCGLLGSLALFIAFETVGVADEERETRVLQLPGADGWSLSREQAGLITLPASLLAFLLGTWHGRRRGART